jgi:hypothetical protein
MELLVLIFWFWVSVIALLACIAFLKQVIIFLSIFVGVPVVIFCFFAYPAFQDVVVWTLMGGGVGWWIVSLWVAGYVKLKAYLFKKNSFIPSDSPRA